MSNIIALCGDAGSGKDTVASLVKQLSDEYVKVYSFAEAIYKLTAAMLGTTHEYLTIRSSKEVTQTFTVSKDSLENMNDLYEQYGFDTKYKLFPTVWEDFQPTLESFVQPYSSPLLDEECLFNLSISPRKALEFVGSEFGRKLLAESVWIDLVINQINEDGPELAVITDVRFANEVNLVSANNGLLVKIERKDNPNKIVSNHESAKGIPDEQCDWLVENNVEGIDSLKEQVSLLLEFSGKEFVNF